MTVDGKDHYLGRHDSPESRAEYERIIAEWLAGGRHLHQDGDSLSINELILRFWDHAQQHYRSADGTPTHELVE